MSHQAIAPTAMPPPLDPATAPSALGGASLLCPPGCQHLPLVAPVVDSAHKARLLWTALALVGGFSLLELAVSLSSHSLALTAEAGHMLSDCGALGLALLATWMARKPATQKAPFGYRRVEILAALGHGLALVAIALWVASEAIARLQTPPGEILGVPMLGMALLGFAVNVLNAALLHDHSHHDLNLRGAFLHMVADAISSIGVVLAAIAVWAFHWPWADAAVSLLVALLVLAGALPLLRQSLNILLERTPEGVDLAVLMQQLLAFEGVESVTALRVWAIAPGQLVLAAQLTVSLASGAARDRLLQLLQAHLRQCGIEDTLLQMTAATPVAPLSLSVPASLELLVQPSVPQP